MTGQTILHYEIREVLGEGSMGVVYKALDRKLDRLVALKFLPAQLAASPDRVERFLQEAAALSAVNHQHIATIYDIEQVDQQRFLVLEYLPGGTLKARIDEAYESGGCLPMDQVFEYARQTAEGLAHAHRRGIVHRDVKTSNLMLTEEGRVKITDFGVAKLGRASGHTTPGSLIGTIRYMSPEQAQGMEVDARSDIFSFGIVLFELTTGRTPFEAENDAALLMKIVTSPAPPLKAIRADVPWSFQQIIARTLMKRPEDRYQKTDELTAELQGLRSVAAPETLTETTRRASTSSTVRARPVKRWAGALFAVAGLLLLGLYFKGHLLPSWARFDRLPAEKRLAVLPFRNIGGNPMDDAFCDGLFETLASKLSQLGQFQGDLKVISTTEVLNEGVKGAREAANVFGATLALTGSLQRSKDKVVVLTELIDAKTQLVLGAHDVEAAASDLPELQDKLVEQVAAMLGFRIKPEAHRAISLGLSRVPGAYESYLQGRGYLQRYDRVENIDKALESFDRALAQDPQYALAYAGRAEAHLRRFQITKDGKFLEQARKSCERAIGLNDRLSAVHLTMGLIHNNAGEYSAAIVSFESALRIEPGSADVYRELANAYVAAGRFDEAEASFGQAIQLRPDDWRGYKDLGVFYNRRGRLGEALPFFKRVVELTPDNYAGYANLGGLYLRLGDYSNALTMLHKSLTINPTEGAYSNLGSIYYLQHRYREAGEMYKKATELNPTDARYWGNLGDADRWSGQEDESAQAYRRAIALLEKQVAINPLDGQLRANLARYWSSVRNKEKALSELSQALRLNPDDGYVLSRAVQVYEESGMRERAIGALQDAIKAGFAIVELQNWPSLAELRRDPRYQQLIDNRSKDPRMSGAEPK